MADTLLIRLIPVDPSLRARIPSAPVSVPSTLNRVGLTAIVTHLLGGDSTSGAGAGLAVGSESGDVTAGYEFCVTAACAAELAGSRGDGAPPPRHLLRGSLRAYARDLGATSETVLSLEFAPALRAPVAGGSSRVPAPPIALASGALGVVAGLEDGSVIFSRVASIVAGDGTASRPKIAHAGGVTGVALVDSSADGSDANFLATAGRDGVVRLWSVASTPASLAMQSLAVECRGADGALGRVAVDPSRALVAAGDAAGTLHVWAADLPQDGGGKGATLVAGAKRVRGAGVGSGVIVDTIQRAPLASLVAHAGTPVTGVAWCSATVVAAASWDRSVSVWDVDGGASASPLAVLRSTKPVTAVTASALGGLLATGHTDGVVRIWDSRGRASSDSPALALDAPASAPDSSRADGLRSTLSAPAAAGAAAWIGDVAWSTRNVHLVSAVDFSGGVKIWDARAPTAPLAILHMHTGKAFAAAWARDGDADVLLTGGEDSVLRATKVEK